MIYQQAHPDHPWLTRTANKILSDLLQEDDVAVEFGSGRSTCWFAQRIGKITSVEHNRLWYEKVKRMIVDRELGNVDYRFAPIEKEEDQGSDSEYVKIIDEMDDQSIDFVLVDGAYRDFCTLRAMRALRPGGILVIDNVNWYLPSNSCSPNSRSHAEGPRTTGVWPEVHQALSAWRCIWTSSGVSDTALFFKPCVNLCHLTSGKAQQAV